MNCRSSRFRSKFHALQLFTWSFLREDTQRTLARGVLAAWLLPVLTTLIAASFLGSPQQVHAQSTATSPTVTLVVLDFDVIKGLDPVLGRKAADAMAVELKNSGNFEVVTRQRVEKAIAENPGLTAPFTPETQVRLAQILGAQGVISGRIISANTPNNRSARIQVEARQLDAATGDIVNGASVNEATLDKLQAIDTDILLDEAINKSAFSLVRTMGQTRLSEGTVLNTTANDVELNLGARNGVAPGQTYSVLRDVLNRSTNQVERLKVAELKILSASADSSTAQVVGGGDTGVRTGDKVRLIFVPRAASPVTPGGAGANSISLPPSPRAASGPGIAKKAGKGLGGILGLGLLVALAGFGGGSSGSRPSSPPTGVVARPLYSGSSTPTVNVNYQSGLPGILAGENVVGYFIYRGEQEGFPTNIGSVIAFVQGDVRSFSDIAYSADILQRTVQINASGSSGNNSTNGVGSGPPVVTIDSTTPPDPTKPLVASLEVTPSQIKAVFFYTPPVPGVQYFYRVQRVTGSAQPDDIGNGNNSTNNGTNNTTNNGSSGVLLPVLSQISSPSGGATPLFRPTVVATSNDLDNFRVTVRVALPTDADNPEGGIGDADQLVVQVVPDGVVASRFEQLFSLPGTLAPNNTTTVGVTSLAADGTFSINLGDIQLQNYTPGDPIDVRVGIRNTLDNPGYDADSRTQENFSFSPVFQVGAPTGTLTIGSRSIATGPNGQRRTTTGLGLPGSPFGPNRAGGTSRSPGYILRPR